MSSGIKHCHLIEMRKDSAEPTLLHAHIRWHRMAQNGEQMPAGFTGFMQTDTSTASENVSAELRGLWDSLVDVFAPLITEYEGHLWSQMGISGVEIYSIFLPWYVPDTEGMGVDLLYHRLDANGARFPYLEGRLTLEHRDMGEQGKERYIMNLNVNKGEIKDAGFKGRVIAACKQGLAMGKQAAQNIEEGK
jgi:hypothetical protein